MTDQEANALKSHIDTVDAQIKRAKPRKPIDIPTKPEGEKN